MAKHNVDIHQHVTTEILEQLDNGPGTFELPWQTLGRDILRPYNFASGRRYNGINVLALWAAARKNGFQHGAWATFKQWQQRGGKVRKGAKSTLAVFFKTITKQVEREDGETEERTIPVAKAFPVFNVDQVDGIELSDLPADTSDVEPVAAADAFLANTGAAIHHDGGDAAYYRPRTDTIHLPTPAQFHGTDDATATERYYAVAFHELTHWTGAAHRCDRGLTGNTDRQAYAKEELIAELGSAFLCADLRLTPQPRRDHAAYIDAWKQLLSDDKRAIFTAASRASEAVAFLHSLQPAKTTEIAAAA